MTVRNILWTAAIVLVIAVLASMVWNGQIGGGTEIDTGTGPVTSTGG